MDLNSNEIPQFDSRNSPKTLQMALEIQKDNLILNEIEL